MAYGVDRFMAKVRIYIEPKDISDFIEIKNRDLIHKIRNVLRLKKGDEIFVFDGKGKECAYSIEELGEKYILAKRGVILRQSNSLDKKVLLAFPLTKEGKVDFILQKATELGVAGFIPFTCERSIKYGPSAKKKQRWNRIIAEATRQSQGVWLPFLEDTVSFNELIKRDCKLKIAGSFNGKSLGSVLLKEAEDVFVIVGPEGDFSLSEYKKLKDNSFKFIRLSSNILRVETACIFFVGLINHIINN